MPGEIKKETVTNLTSKFFTNENGNSLFKKLKGAFEHKANLYAFHAVVGYFRGSGKRDIILSETFTPQAF